MSQTSPPRAGHLKPATQDLIHRWLFELEAQDVTSGNQGKVVGSPQALPGQAIHLLPNSNGTRTNHYPMVLDDNAMLTPQRRTMHENLFQSHQSPMPDCAKEAFLPSMFHVEQHSMTSKRIGKLGYERQPRHKTKEGRYGYKGSNGGNKCNKSSTKRKISSKKPRKHTINGNFHAPNVPRDRLTLRGNLDLGLFHRGKTSSPVKCCELKDFPNTSSIGKLVKGRRASKEFSETKFLNKRVRDDNEDQSSHHCQSKMRKTQTSPETPHNITSNHSPLKYVEHRLSEGKSSTDAKDLVSDFSSVSRAQSQEISGACFEAAKEDNTADDRSLGLSLTRPKRQYSTSQKYRELPPLTAVYTWSSSGQVESIPESVLNFYARQILQFDLHSEVNLQDKVAHRNRRYWTLEELKFLLYEREKFWNQEANGQSAPAPPILYSLCSKHESGSEKEIDDAERIFSKTAASELGYKINGKDNEEKTDLNQEWVLPQSIDANLEIECSKHDSGGYPNNWESILMNHCSVSEAIAYPQSFPEGGGLCYSPTLSQIIDAFEHEQYHANGAQTQNRLHDHLDAQALDHELDDITMSEAYPMYKIRDYIMGPPFGTASSERSFLPRDVSQCQAPWAEASANNAFGIAGAIAGSLLDHHATQEYDPDPESIGLPRDFWRQKRLY